MAQLELLDDESIIDFTSDPDGKQRIIYDHRDVNLKNKPFKPWAHGLYDPTVFGSCYEDRCICGNIRTLSKEPCPQCEARVYSREEALRSFARIELPFYYLSALRFDIFHELFVDIFADSKIELNFMESDLKNAGYRTRRL